MSWRRGLRTRLRALFDRDTHEAEMAEELRFHLEQEAAHLRDGGMPAREAQRRAAVRLGGTERVKEDVRDARGFRVLEDLVADLRVGLRGLRRHPTFSVAAAVTLTLGIGGTAAMFSVANALLFRPFPAPDPDRLVVIAQADEHGTELHGLSYPEYRAYAEATEVFRGLAARTRTREVLGGDGASGPVWTTFVTRNFFDVLGVTPSRGRPFVTGEGAQDDAVAVLTHRAWRTRFASDPTILGRRIQLGALELTVIGVTPASFASSAVGIDPELYVPIDQMVRVRPAARHDPTDWTLESFSLLGRLRDDVPVPLARERLGTVTAALAASHPDAMEHSRLWIDTERRSRPVPELASSTLQLMGLLMAVATLVLLIACANVGTLLVSRGVTRRHELALRAGLGASRARLLRQLLAESLLLAALGGLGGAVVATWVTRLIGQAELWPTLGPVSIAIGTDWRVFLFTAAAAGLTALAAGLAPAWRTSRVDVTRTIGHRHDDLGREPSLPRLSSVLVVAQVALSMLLLVCGGLFVRSAQHAAEREVGFRTDDLLLVSIDPVAQGHGPERALALYRDVAAEVAALPGVQAVGWARAVPQSGDHDVMGVVTLDGGAAPETDPARLLLNYADARFLETIEVPVVRGRGFTDAEARLGAPLALLSETAAERLWPGQDAVGRRFLVDGTTGPTVEVVGVIRDAYYAIEIMRVTPYVILPLAREGTGPATLHVATSHSPAALAPAVAAILRRHDPAVALLGLTSMADHVSRGVVRTATRLGAATMGTFGALGALLAMVGLYGVVAYSVVRRRREFGIRRALGATIGGILRLALARGMLLTAVGLGAGTLAAAAVTPVASGFLLEVDPREPLLFLLTACALGTAAGLACLVPARRAAAESPLATLKTE